jgi:ABC-type uncharacterized transport system ATPase subunit
MTAPSPAASATRVRMRGIRKQFGPTLALDGVDFDLGPGEVHALLGENGAGKSTLMHLLAGLLTPDAGEIELGGERRRFRSARDAAAAGVGMVHQHFTLVENFTVAENLALALPSQTPALLPGAGLGQRAFEVAEGLGWALDPGARVWQLPVGMQQRLEIVKVLAQDPGVLILDEPTAVLTAAETAELFRVVRRLRGEGRAVVFISHKLGEVLEIADRITVLRRGRNAGSLQPAETTPHDLARRMVGDDALALDRRRPGKAPGAAAPVLSVRDLRVRDDRGLEAVRGLSLEVRPGEILALAGVDGNGQTELAEAIAGLRPFGGEVEAGHGIGYVPADRRRAGLAPGLSVRDNLILELHASPGMRRGPWLRWPALNAAAREMADSSDIRGRLEQPAGTLSGGNQQKVVLARALRKEPPLLLAVYPTRGLDVRAAAWVHDRLRALRDTGAGVLLLSTELDEVLLLADRIGVLYEGRLVGIVPPETPRETLGLMMGGRAPGGDA